MIVCTDHSHDSSSSEAGLSEMKGGRRKYDGKDEWLLE